MILVHFHIQFLITKKINSERKYGVDKQITWISREKCYLKSVYSSEFFYSTRSTVICTHSMQKYEISTKFTEYLV